MLNYIQSATKVLHNIIIFTSVIYVLLSIIVVFTLLVDDFLINKSAQVLMVLKS